MGDKIPKEGEEGYDPTKHGAGAGEGEGNGEGEGQGEGEGEGEGDKGDGKKKKDGEDRPDETPEAKRARLERELDRHNKKFPKVEKKDGDKSGELDYSQKAFLVASGVKEADEMELVKKAVAMTGQTIEQVLGDEYFQGKLKSMRELRASKEALPGNSKRPGNSSKDTVEYWIAKGELPPPEMRELRTKVVNARLAKEKDTGQFTDTPVVR